MIKALHLKNFKCFEDQGFELGNLTLLTGLNGTGKSSVIQSLLLLRQSYQQHFLQTNRLLLNGDLIKLGTAQDIVHQGTPSSDSVEFDLEFSSGLSAKWCFKWHGKEVPELISPLPSTEVYNDSILGDNFHYLSADRIGPQSVFEGSTYFVGEHKQLGIRGKYTPHFLDRWGGEFLSNSGLSPKAPANDNRAYPGSEPSDLTLGNQVNKWMDEISPGVQIQATHFGEIDQVDLRYTFPRGSRRSNPMRSTNVGFGITYTLPIVLALLASKEDTLVLLENPEAHLHPKGQVKLGELMVRAASCGIQVIVESHSDHILNGIRIAVRDKIITPDKVRLYYLSRPTDQLSSKVESPRVEEDGRINDWPEGFFDEFENSLVKLF